MDTNTAATLDFQTSSKFEHSLPRHGFQAVWTSLMFVYCICFTWRNYTSLSYMTIYGIWRCASSFMYVIKMHIGWNQNHHFRCHWAFLVHMHQMQALGSELWLNNVRRCDLHTFGTWSLYILYNMIESFYFPAAIGL